MTCFDNANLREYINPAIHLPAYLIYLIYLLGLSIGPSICLINLATHQVHQLPATQRLAVLTMPSAGAGGLEGLERPLRGWLSAPGQRRGAWTVLEQLQGLGLDETWPRVQRVVGWGGAAERLSGSGTFRLMN